MKRLQRRLLLGVVPVVTALAVGVPAAFAEGVWVRGKAHSLVTGPPSSTTTGRPALLYVIAPVSRRHPLHPFADAITHGYGAHDHVAARVFSGPCDLTLLVPGAHGKGKVETRRTQTPLGPKPLVYAVQLDGRMRPLTSVARIHRAESTGLVAPVDTQTVISCTVKP
jgi:hypothetical protein